jgi:hypothetical protein
MKLPPNVADWPEAARLDYEERAGILEHDGGRPRAEAELFAMRGVRLKYEGEATILSREAP